MAAPPRPARSIVDDFADHQPKAAGWLAGIVDGRVPEGVAAPFDEDPLDYLIAMLRKRDDPALWTALAEAAGELLAAWLASHAEDPTPNEAALRRVSAVLSILERVPAPPSVSMRLFWMCHLSELKGLTIGNRDLWRQALIALAVSPPLHRLALQDLAAFFIEQMQDPPYVVAAFTGLRRVWLDKAVEQVPLLLRALRERGLPPDQPLRNLLRALEDAPERAWQLGQVMASEPAEADELIHVLREDVDAPGRFPAAWVAFERGFEGNPIPSDSDSSFVPRAPLDRARIARALERLDAQASDDLLSPGLAPAA